MTTFVVIIVVIGAALMDTAEAILIEAVFLLAINKAVVLVDLDALPVVGKVALDLTNSVKSEADERIIGICIKRMKLLHINQ